MSNKSPNLVTLVASCHSCYETHFGTACMTSVLICPRIQCQATGLPTTTNEWCISLILACMLHPSTSHTAGWSYVIHSRLYFHPSTSSGSSISAAVCIQPKIWRAHLFYLTRWLWFGPLKAGPAVMNGTDFYNPATWVGPTQSQSMYQWEKTFLVQKMVQSKQSWHFNNLCTKHKQEKHFWLRKWSSLISKDR